MKRTSITAAMIVSCALLYSSSEDSNDCQSKAKPMHATVRHIEAGGIGYENGYTTLEAFFSHVPDSWRIIPFLDLRGHIFNTGRLAANAGFGLRGICSNRVYGGNLYYDYREGKHKGYSQISGGLETLGKRWDLRINGYIPVGAKKSKPYDIGFGGFNGHSMLVSQRREYSMWGVDAEAGLHFGKANNFDFYFAAGPYYFKGDLGEGALGGKARLAGYYRDLITLEFSDSYDSVFHNKFQGQLGFSIAFGPRSKLPRNSKGSCNQRNILASRLTQSTGRQEIVVLNTENQALTASDYFVFVDNTSSSLGTYESPYPTLAEAQAHSSPGDIIYVFPGNGSSSGMDGGIVLKDQQKLWGSGNSHVVNTEWGAVIVPQLSAQMPEISNPSGSGVFLAKNNEVSGISLTNCDVAGIAGSDCGDISILHCSLDDLIVGIDLSFADSLEHNALIDEVTISNSSVYGIFTGVGYSSILNMTISNSTLTGNLTPLDLQNVDDSIVLLNVLDNVFSNSAEFINITSGSTSSTQQTYNLVGNRIAGTGDYSLYCELYSSSTASINLTGNTFTDNYSSPRFLLSTSSPISLNVQNNHFMSSSMGTGFLIEYSGGGTVEGTFLNNVAQNNSDAGFYFIQDSAGTMCFDMQNNVSSSNGGPGYSLYNSLTGTFSVSPCNANSINVGDLFGDTMNTISHVESCPSGSICP